MNSKDLEKVPPGGAGYRRIQRNVFYENLLNNLEFKPHQLLSTKLDPLLRPQQRDSGNQLEQEHISDSVGVTSIRKKTPLI